MLRSDLCDYSNANIVVKGFITITNPDGTKRNKQQHLKITYHSSIASQKLMA